MNPVSPTKRLAYDATLFLLITVGFILFLTAIGMIGRANAGSWVSMQGAAAAAPAADDPVGLMQKLYLYMKDGAHLPAVGAMLMLIVWVLRMGATKLPGKLGAWFTGTLGGWVLGFGAAALAFVGPALMAGQMVTFGLLMQALGTGFAASGKWEGLRDAWGSLFGDDGKPPSMGIVKRGAVVAAAGAILIASCSGCPGVTNSGPVQDVVACTKLESPAAIAVASQCGHDLSDWHAVESCVIANLPKLGWDVAGCVLADLVEQYLMTKGAPMDIQKSQDARAVLEDYRANYGHGAIFRTKDGDL